MNNFQHFFVKKTPEILIGFGIGGFFAGAFWAVKDTPKAIVLLGRRRDELGLEEDEKLPVKEVIKTTWKIYAPKLAVMGASAACIILAQNENNKRIAAVTAVASLSESALFSNKDKIIESFVGKKDEKKEGETEKEDKKEEIKDTQNTTIIISGNGDVLFVDSLSNQEIYTNKNKVLEAVNNFNYRMRMEMYLSLSEFYYEVEIPKTDVSDYLFWNVDDGPIEVRFVADFNKDGVPCAVIKYNRLPKYI